MFVGLPSISEAHTADDEKNRCDYETDGGKGNQQAVHPEKGDKQAEGHG